MLDLHEFDVSAIVGQDALDIAAATELTAKLVSSELVHSTREGKRAKKRQQAKASTGEGDGPAQAGSSETKRRKQGRVRKHFGDPDMRGAHTYSPLLVNGLKGFGMADGITGSNPFRATQWERYAITPAEGSISMEEWTPARWSLFDRVNRASCRICDTRL